MRPNTDQTKKSDKKQYTLNLALAAVTGQVGCLTIIIVLAALFGGLWLDNHFATERPVFTIGLMIASIPVSLAAIFWVVMKVTSRIKTVEKKKPENQEEDIDLGEHA